MLKTLRDRVKILLTTGAGSNSDSYNFFSKLSKVKVSLINSVLQTYFKIFKKVNGTSTLLSFRKFLWFDRGEGEGLGEGRAIRGIRTTAKVEINPATFAYLICYLC